MIAVKREPLHPAKYSPSVINLMDQCIRAEAFSKPKRLRRMRTLDPMAGTGRVHQLPGVTVGIELEPEWACMHPDTIVGDALDLPFRKDHFDVIAVSPVYGNRFSDHHNAQDGSTRRSYTHDLGRELTPGNSGVMEFRNYQVEDAPYRSFHEEAWREATRVLRPSGLFLLNVSDFIAKGEVQKVGSWHVGALLDLRYRVIDTFIADTPRMRFGANRERVPNEWVIALRAPA